MESSLACTRKYDETDYFFKNSYPIFIGKETSVKRIIVVVIITGISTSAFMLALIIIAGIIDPTNPLTYQNLFSSFVFAAIFGLVCIFILLWSFFIVGKYRSWLFKKISKK